MHQHHPQDSKRLPDCRVSSSHDNSHRNLRHHREERMCDVIFSCA